MPDNNSILEKLEGLVSRYEEVSTLITDPSVIADQERFVRLTREYKDLDDIMKARKKYIACLNAIKEAKDILANENDPDLKDMAKEELQINEDLQPQIEEEIKIALVPKDPEDAKNVQMEIRAGTGGDEAALFAGDLFQMYKKFCDAKGWNLSVTSVSEGAVGGYKEIDFAVSTSRNATIVITHYQRMLNYIKPDFIHILYGGRIVLTGGPELALELEANGYDRIKADADAGRL